MERLVVGNDASWSQIAREQIKLLKDDVGSVLGRTDYHMLAEGLGAAGLLVKDDNGARGSCGCSGDRPIGQTGAYERLVRQI